MNRLIVVVLCCVLLPLVAGAAELTDYPEFRYTSGLPGGGNGVTPDGHIGFEGALQLNIPVGYTPGWGNFMVTAQTASVNGGFPTTIKGADVNGALTMGLGMFRKNALWFSSMGTGAGKHSLEPAMNLQFQALTETKSCPGIAVGVTDLLNQRAATIHRPYAGSARSFYAVATRQGGTPEHPLFYTLGLGTGRFKHGFAGVSYQAIDRLKVLAEYDSWSVNVGAAYDVLRSKQWHAVFGLGLVNLDRADVSLSVTRTDF